MHFVGAMTVIYTFVVFRPRIDLAIITWLAKQCTPDVHAHMLRLECPLELVVSRWLLPMFAQGLETWLPFLHIISYILRHKIVYLGSLLG